MIPFIETQFNTRNARFSPDGHWILYLSNQSGQDETYLVPFPGPGGKWQVSSNGSNGAGWNKEGDKIYNGTIDGTIYEIPTQFQDGTPQIGTPQKLFQNPAMNDVSIAPDGQSFLIVQRSTDALSAPITLVSNWSAILKNTKR